ncbi:MAG: hypothetical protein BGO12_17790 [Verrucomicrobia bacterium 61-8]|nr:MAG: hypothetical protein BGO12_17790 [Verrucomicrobia bacterium 61-8]
MNWVISIWSMTAAVCATLAVLNGAVWFRNRSSANGVFAIMAACSTAVSLCELSLMLATSAAVYAEILRWAHVPVSILIIEIVSFTRVYLKAGRPWLAWTVYLFRVAVLSVNFLTGENINFTRIDSLTHAPFLGTQVAIPVGERNPWMIMAQMSLLILAAFMVNAAWEVWRRGERRKALVTGGAFILFIAMGTTQSALSLWGVVNLPVIPSVFFVGVVVVIGLELSRDMMRAGELASELREGEKRLALAAEAAHLGVWSRERAREEIWASPNWRRLFGFSASERVTLNQYLERVAPEDRELVKEALWHPNQSDDRYEVEYRIVLPDGRMRWIASRGRFESGASGHPGAACAVSVDITAKKEADRVLQENREELAHLSRVAMLGELSGSLAHELNQPLAAIMSNAQAAQRFLAREDFDRQEMAEILGDIVAADQQAGDVIRSLRALFKKGETNRQPVDANETLCAVLRLVRNDLMNHQISVETHFADGLPRVQADRVQIQQVVLNLIFNGAEAMAEAQTESRRLVVSTERQGADVRIAVRDGGPGLAPGMEAEIFEPFFTTKAHGLGLGLVVCRSILEGHGSVLEVRNHPEGGAEFSFVLKAATSVPS